MCILGTKLNFKALQVKNEIDLKAKKEEIDREVSEARRKEEVAK